MDEIPTHYRKYYVSYKKIRRDILKMGRKYKKKLEKDLIQNAAKRVDKQGIKMLPPFLYNDIISHEIKKVNKFAESKYRDIIDNLVSVYKVLKSMECSGDYIEKEDIERKLDLIGCDIIHFDFYIHKNSKIIMKLGFFFDKVMNISINQWLLLGLIKEKFCNINIDNLIVYLSFLYTLLRSLNENSNRKENSSTWKPPDTFERTSTKFLIKYDDIVYTKVKIVKHLPYLIFGMNNRDLEEHLKSMMGRRPWEEGKVRGGPTEKANANVNANANAKEIVEAEGDTIDGEDAAVEEDDVVGALTESQQITSIYFDNKEATCYSNRILRYENAQLIRFRWYNDNQADPNKDIFIERKIHHEEWTGEVSTKERFELEQKNVLKFMNGELNVKEFFLKKFTKKKKELLAEGALKAEHGSGAASSIAGEARHRTREVLRALEKKTKKNIKLGSEIQGMIVRNKLEPIIRTSYLRSAFQLSNDNTVRISIDTNVSMLNEYVRKREHWCRLAEEALGKNEIIRLNYGIIEVKLKVDKMPEWIHNILSSNESINAYKYSKYQTAMALLHPEKITYIPIWVHKNIHEKFKSKNILNEPMLKDCSNYNQENINLDTINISEVNNNNCYCLKKYDVSNEHTTQMYLSAQHNTLENWNVLEKTSIWLSNKYNKNLKVNEKINLLKIDPKINFAAERTFIHYSHISVYITLLALFLEKYKEKNGNIYVIIILLFLTSFSSLISSYFFFLKRIDVIQKRKTREPILGRIRFDSFYSPLIFLVLLFFSIVLSIYFNFDIKTKHIP
ncbi:vacuolar transporter chaperone, putative [Plasmodium ovale]|uniref:Vacuolar transporter chaperone, putative n=2 Tax=Plasmodium ovale TaxID=36330 RepID=A0A1A8WN00_PLAOA|nr:vacuolar transporter chaperone, putative [Plasmodium ovale curtisi]SCP05048.1 vacuolar transporter chaperone, putative [Plasmodium ovale]